jgi:hypothetical protein
MQAVRQEEQVMIEFYEEGEPVTIVKKGYSIFVCC